jgi:hypothetical protein
MHRVFLAPLKPGSRSPEEFRAAVTAALDEEDEGRGTDDSRAGRSVVIDTKGGSGWEDKPMNYKRHRPKP